MVLVESAEFGMKVGNVNSRSLQAFGDEGPSERTSRAEHADS